MSAVIGQDLVETIVINGIDRSRAQQLVQLLYSEYGISASLTVSGWGRRREYTLTATRFSVAARELLKGYQRDHVRSVKDRSCLSADSVKTVSAAQLYSNRVLLQR